MFKKKRKGRKKGKEEGREGGRKKKEISNAGEAVEKLEPLHVAGRKINGATTEIVSFFTKK